MRKGGHYKHAVSMMDLEEFPPSPLAGSPRWPSDPATPKGQPRTSWVCLSPPLCDGAEVATWTLTNAESRQAVESP